MIVSLELHDLSLENNQFFYLNKLRELYPNFKLSAFYIPYDIQYLKKLNNIQRKQVVGMIRIAVAEGWLELIPHGVTHRFGEFAKADYKTMETVLKGYEEYFKELDVPYVKGFCAPNWLISDDAIKCLDDNGWWLAVDRNQPDATRAKQSYEYNWDIADKIPDLPIVMGHGHMSLPSVNNLPACLSNLSKIPPDAEWRFVSEIMEGIVL